MQSRVLPTIPERVLRENPVQPVEAPAVASQVQQQWERHRSDRISQHQGFQRHILNRTCPVASSFIALWRSLQSKSTSNLALGASRKQLL